jgi:uncharacterized protein
VNFHFTDLIRILSEFIEGGDAMSRLLFLAAVAIVIYWLLQSRRGRPSGGGRSGDKVEDMVRCSHCGIHLPKSEGLLADGKYFCSKSHLRAWSDTRPEV